MVYHSTLNEADVQVIAGCGMLPIKTSTRGPAPLAAEDAGDDIIDESLAFFKANVLFKHFEVKGPADRVLIYLTLYTTQCLQKLEKCPTPMEGLKSLTAMAHEQFRIPGDPGFALGSFFPAPANAQEGEVCRQYLKQVREELGRRLVAKVYGEDGQPSKFWIVFAKRKFMNKAL
jgi:actin related protein 2/3 complex subunit 3